VAPRRARPTPAPHVPHESVTERGFDVAFASLTFDCPTLEKQDRRKSYGEVRVVATVVRLATGDADGIILTVVSTDRGDETSDSVRRIISARRSDRREGQAYRAAVAADAE
jgi:uncharacterized DUF497 family protein